MLPFAIPASTAAKIAGLSSRAFRRRVIEPLVARDGSKIVLASLERHLGEPITIERFLTADRARDAARTAQRLYRKRNHE
jgi:hypothetical protein